jgi:hypothetical protein
VDRRHLVVDPDPTCHFAADLDLDPFTPASWKIRTFKLFYSNAYLHCFIIYRYLSHQ